MFRVFGPLLETLREMGGEGSAMEVMRAVADRVLSGTSERDRMLKSGVNAAENEVAWARNYLKEAGLIDPSIRGVWRLILAGWDTHIRSVEEARNIGFHPETRPRARAEEPPRRSLGRLQRRIRRRA